MQSADLTPSPTWRDRAFRLIYRIGYPVAQRWWGLWRRPHVGALVAVHVGEALLLVRSSYRTEWNLPGGGVKEGETPQDAARRELFEEIGVTAPALESAFVASGIWDRRPDQVHFFRLRLEQLPALRLDNREVIAARLFGPAELAGLLVTGPTQAYLDGVGRRST